MHFMFHSKSRVMVLALSCCLWAPIPAMAELEPVVPVFDGRSWKQGFTQESESQARRITEWVLSDETVENWSELVTDFFMQLPANADPQKALQAYFTNMKALGNIKSVLSSDPNEIIYEFQAGSGSVIEHGIHRIFVSKGGLHNVQYATKNGADFTKNKDKWTKLLKQFKVK